MNYEGIAGLFLSGNEIKFIRFEVYRYFVKKQLKENTLWNSASSNKTLGEIFQVYCVAAIYKIIRKKKLL